ncbi:MAG: catechol 2,3-dioxygenase-like lactoylglutathione lyase family enzyme [Pseudohongiellaceae bacterium]|jgi:catechol 2,3-dioxygenase-like lactoylglutathione lyase family enzyme
MKTKSNVIRKSAILSRRTLLKAIPALSLSSVLFAQSGSAIAVRKLHSYGMRVSNVERSVRFYQDLFGASIQSRQGASVCLRIGEGPRFFSLSPLLPGQAPGFSHIGLSVENFDLESVRDQLDALGVSHRAEPGPNSASLDIAMQSWTRIRGQSEGGSASGTQELFFADIEGLIYQLNGADHCGGAGESGDVCERVEEASADGMFRSLEISHFTNFLANKDRANEFYTRAFGLGFQAYQGPTSPIVGVGDGIQFLMYVGGDESGAPTQPARVDHVCLSVEDFDVDGIIAKLEDYGFTPRENADNTPPLVHWISMRMPDRGGIERGTPEVYFSDPDGIRIQLQDAVYCGGGGYLGDDCSAPV